MSPEQHLITRPPKRCHQSVSHPSGAKSDVLSHTIALHFTGGKVFQFKKKKKNLTGFSLFEGKENFSGYIIIGVSYTEKSEKEFPQDIEI